MSVAMIGADVVSIPTGVTGTDDNDNIIVTMKALTEVKKIKEQNGIADDYGLRLGVKGGGCSGMSYTLGFDAATKETDLVLSADGVRIFIDAKSMFYLMGMTLDFSDGLMGQGF
ncbi:MAG: HesB/IscA family protein, partial [Candidatus Kapaibacterium sp.]